MQRRSNIQMSSLIVLLSILTILIELSAYYFFASPYPVLGIASFVSILCCHILLEKSTTYESCFTYTLLTVFIILTVTILTYFSADRTSFISYSHLLHAILALNWLVPSIHCFLRYMTGYGTRINQYPAFYRSNSIIFILFYLGILIYGSFAEDAFPWAYRAVMWSNTANYTPFLVLARQIEDYLYRIIPLRDIFVYLGVRILIFAPYGYYVTLLTRKNSRLLKHLLFLLLPLLIEVFQYFLFTARCDIDDFIYGFLGGLLGSLLFYLTDRIFHSISGRTFLERERTYGSTRYLYF
ncbi:MAG: hypothetical protein E7255_07065 [Lachnospiraceae bacterium]|nr:hypothetical protein [Lachnospiraceae bacterium]